MSETPQPTEHDHENARIRQEIADRQAQEYGQVLAWALGAFGPGWEPSCRHFLVSKQEEDRVRYTGDRPVAAATVYVVKNAKEVKRHFTVTDGQVVECAGYEEGFGSMLLEPHPTQTIEVKGQRVHPHRYSLCWAPYELYHPKSAEQLSALRVSRERGKEERADKKFAEENPLLAQAGIRRADLEG